MALFINLSNLIIRKSAISDIGKLKEIIEFGGEEDQEDNFLISIPQMNPEEHAILVSYLEKLGVSQSDYVILTRYGGLLWDIDWLQTKADFCWHVDEDSKIAPKAQVLDNLSVNEILEIYGSLIGFLDFLNE